MLQTEISGKISYSVPPNERMEDVLTCYILSMFRYINNLELPMIFLNESVNILGHRLDLKEIHSAKIFFWPWVTSMGGGARQPDALIILKQLNGYIIAILVEAKYEAGLSNIPGKNIYDGNKYKKGKQEDITKYRHQLADEYCGIKCGKWAISLQQEIPTDARKYILYITGNYEIPRQDIEETINKIRRHKCWMINSECAPNPENDIFWVSWRNLYSIIYRSHNDFLLNYSEGEWNYIKDLKEILSLRGLKDFYAFDQYISCKEYQRFFTLKIWNILNPIEKYYSFYNKQK